MNLFVICQSQLILLQYWVRTEEPTPEACSLSIHALNDSYLCFVSPSPVFVVGANGQRLASSQQTTRDRWGNGKPTGRNSTGAVLTWVTSVVQLRLRKKQDEKIWLGSWDGHLGYGTLVWGIPLEFNFPPQGWALISIIWLQSQPFEKSLLKIFYLLFSSFFSWSFNNYHLLIFTHSSLQNKILFRGVIMDMIQGFSPSV